MEYTSYVFPVVSWMRSKPGYQTHTGKMIQAGKETSLSSQDTICPALVNCVCAGRGVTSSETCFQETCGGLELGGYCPHQRLGLPGGPGVPASQDQRFLRCGRRLWSKSQVSAGKTCAPSNEVTLNRFLWDHNLSCWN